MSLESHYYPPTPHGPHHDSADIAVEHTSSSSTYPFSPEQKQNIFSPAQPYFSEQLHQSDHWPNQMQSTQDFGSNRQDVSSYVPRSFSRSSFHEASQGYPHSMVSRGSPTGLSLPTASSHHRHNFNTVSPSQILGGQPPASEASFAAAVSQSLNAMDTASDPTYHTNGPAPTFDASMYTFPVLGHDEHNRSPFAMADGFTAWLFDENQNMNANFNPSPSFLPGYEDPAGNQFFGPVGMSVDTVSPSALTQQNPMSFTNILATASPSHYIMSEEKRQELLDLISTQFNERPHDAVKKRKEAVFEGDVNEDGHILSLKMMHLYLGSYWYHQHAQLPILHKASFSADKTPNLLLLAVIAIGAATMDKQYGTSLTDSAAEFSNFLAWHIRWEILRDADFRPPAKLWIFQTLLLIEVYEKMYATRALHERAHIQHDITLTLMRRGSSLVGRTAFDTPPSMPNPATSNSSGSNSANSALQGSLEDPWTRWISAEATIRAAFAAFVLDSTHATMFGHSAKMVAHEMRLPLPCDESQWSAASAAEVSRIQQSLVTNGIRPITFLEGLKRTLSGQRVRTNSFGRTILMSGLLSVSWHMKQRDLQITSLGAQSFGFVGRDKWRGALLRAFDNWKRDFDEALAEAMPLQPAQLQQDYSSIIVSPRIPLPPVDDENIFESRTVLHHLAHMASHVDIWDCQVFAGASRLLGRTIAPREHADMKLRMAAWAKKATARDAAFYALKFLAQVLIHPFDTRKVGVSILPHAFEQNQYLARDDFLLNRPWILYFSALVIWTYGFALEGPITPKVDEGEFMTREQRDEDMKAYLENVGGIQAPDDLEDVKGKNRCLGLLINLKESFKATRWEMTQEASSLLGNCIAKLKGGEGRQGILA